MISYIVTCVFIVGITVLHVIVYRLLTTRIEILSGTVGSRIGTLERRVDRLEELQHLVRDRARLAGNRMLYQHPYPRDVMPDVHTMVARAVMKSGAASDARLNALAPKNPPPVPRPTSFERVLKDDEDP